MNFSSETLVNAVRTVVLNFEEMHSNAKKTSIQDIADKANSSYTTIREIKKGVLKNLSIKKALEISSRLNGPSTLEELLKANKNSNPEEVEELSKKYSHLFDYSILPTELDQLFGNKEFSKILWAAFSNKHITRDEIIYRWGKEGEDKMEFLLETEMVVEEDGLIKGVAEKAGGGPQTAIKELEVGLSSYKLSNSEKEENWVSFQTNSVNNAFIKSFREELRTFFKKFDEKSNSSEFYGNKQMFFGMIFDRYIEDLKGQEEKLQ